MRIKKTALDGRWFVADRPIDDPAQDAFSHADVADNLRLIIERADPNERIMIGLLGPFGVGKSTVVRLLARKFQDERFEVVRVSAERHETPGLHRSLIYAFAEELVKADGFSRADVEEVLQRLEQKTSRTQTDMLAAPVFQLIRSIPTAVGLKNLMIAIAVAALLVAAVVFWAVSHHWTGASIFAAVTSVVALVGGSVPGFLLLGASRWVSNATQPGEFTTETPRVESADEFERSFADLVQINKKKTLIIALDDLDRLSPGEVLEGLNAIRSFQLTCPVNHRPIFIVSADEEIIEAAIARSNPGLAATAPMPAARAESAQAFLERLFTHRQTMPAHAGTDLAAFATKILDSSHAGAQALGSKLGSVIEVLIHTGVQDPRHVTRLVNGFFADYLIARAREGRDNATRSIAAGLVTGQPEVLARMTVLKIDFPRFHRALFDDEELLDRLAEGVAGTAEISDDDKANSRYGTKQASDDWSRLLNFVGRTSNLQSPGDLSPFLYLGQEELDRILGGKEARDFRNALVDRRVDELRDRFAALADDPDRLDGLAQVTAQVLNRAHGLELNNALDALTRVLDLFPSASYAGLAAAVVTAFGSGAQTPPDTQPLLLLVHAAEQPHHRAELAEKILHTGLDPATSRELVVLTGRAELSATLQPTTVTEYLVAAFTRLGQTSLESVERWLEALEANPAPDLSPVFLASALQVLDRSEDDVPTSWSGPLERLFDQAARPDGSSPGSEPLPGGLIEPTTRLITDSLSSTSAGIAVAGMERFRLDAVDATAFAEALTAGLEALPASRHLSPATWDAIFAILCRAVRDNSNETILKGSNQALTAYFEQQNGEENAASAIELVTAAVQSDSSAVEGAVAALTTSWTTSGERLSTASTLEPLLELLADLSASSAAALSSSIVEAGRPNTDSELRQGVLRVLPLMRTSSRGRAILDQLAQVHTPQVSYNISATNLEQDLEGLAEIYAISTPAPSTTQSLIDTYRSVLSYQPAAGVTALCTIWWPGTHTNTVLAILDGYAGSLTPDDLHRLIGQLSRVEFNLPTSLVAPLQTALIDEGKSDDADDRSRANVVAAQLGVTEAVAIALQVTDGEPIIADSISDDTTQASQAIASYVQTLDTVSGLHGPSSVRIGAAIQAAAPAHSIDAIDDLAIDQIRGNRNLQAHTWADLLTSVTSPQLQTTLRDQIDEAADGNTATLGCFQHLSQGVLLSGITWSHHQDRLIANLEHAIDDERDKERARALASILNVPTAARDLALNVVNKRWRDPKKIDAADAARDELSK